MNRILLTLAVGFAPCFLQAQDLPRDVEDTLNKLNKFEHQVRAEADDKIFDKRTEVSDFLQTALTRETKAGNLEGAVAIKKLIESLKEKTSVRKPPPTAQSTGQFEKWLTGVELHSEEGWWEIVGNELVQHLNGGAERRFACKINEQKNFVSFAANGRTYFFQFLSDRSQGIRSADDDWPAKIFTVKKK